MVFTSPGAAGPVVRDGVAPPNNPGGVFLEAPYVAPALHPLPAAMPIAMPAPAVVQAPTAGQPGQIIHEATRIFEFSPLLASDIF